MPSFSRRIRGVAAGAGAVYRGTTVLQRSITVGYTLVPLYIFALPHTGMKWVIFLRFAWATRCETARLRWCALKLLRCLKIEFDVPRWKVQHAQYFATDFGIYQLFIIRFSYGFHHCDWNSISFHVIRIQNSQFNISYYHRSNKHRRRMEKHAMPTWVADWPHCCDF